MKIFGVWIRECKGWLTLTTGEVFNTTSKKLAEAQADLQRECSDTTFEVRVIDEWSEE